MQEALLQKKRKKATSSALVRVPATSSPSLTSLDVAVFSRDAPDRRSAGGITSSGGVSLSLVPGAPPTAARPREYVRSCPARVDSDIGERSDVQDSYGQRIWRKNWKRELPNEEPNVASCDEKNSVSCHKIEQKGKWTQGPVEGKGKNHSTLWHSVRADRRGAVGRAFFVLPAWRSEAGDAAANAADGVSPPVSCTSRLSRRASKYINA